MLYFQKYDFSHMNLHPNNIYINCKKNNLIYFGPPKIVKNYTNDSTYLWYSSPEEDFLENEYNKASDIWSLGCIICELFFINFPLFQVYSKNEKIMKIIDILGFPSFQDVDYINKYQYDSIYKRRLNHSKDNNLFQLLLSPKEEKSNLYNFKVALVEIIKGCLDFNRKKRLKLGEILNKLEYLNNNISSEFHSKILETINISQESETNNSINKNNYNSKNIINNQEMDSEDFKESSIDNNFNNNINENNFPSININKEIQNLNNLFKAKNNINQDKIAKERYKDENEINDKKYMKESGKKENIIEYFKESKNIKENDEYKELDKSKFIIINNNILFFRNR
jgi:serine/threonine protein kinase